jgi:hypothetical protein
VKRPKKTGRRAVLRRRAEHHSLGGPFWDFMLENVRQLLHDAVELDRYVIPYSTAAPSVYYASSSEEESKRFRLAKLPETTLRMCSDVARNRFSFAETA